MKEELISIIVPVYNVEKYIEKCLDSIINQTYTNLEIILVDDGSKDRSGEICDIYQKKDKRIKVIHNTNSGVSKTRNCGLNEANGKYICFADADDYLMEDYVEYLYNLIKENDAQISLTTQMFSNFDSIQEKNITTNILNAEDTTVRILNYKIPIGVYSKLFDADLIKNNNIKFKEELFMGEGFNFNVDCFQRSNRVIISNKKIYFYRRDNQTSATTSFSIKKCENSLYAMKIMNESFILKNDNILNSWNYALWRTYSDAFDYICLGNGKKNHKIKYKEYKKFIKENYKFAYYVDISKRDLMRARIMGICPELMPVILKIRRFKYRIKLDSRCKK